MVFFYVYKVKLKGGTGMKSEITIDVMLKRIYEMRRLSCIFIHQYK